MNGRGRWDIQDESKYWDEPDRLFQDTVRATVEQVRQDRSAGLGDVQADRELIRWMRRHDVSSNACILDLGCGGGRLSLVWELSAGEAGFDHDLSLIDHAPGAIAVAQVRGPAWDCRVGEASRLTETFPDVQFDVIFTHTVLQHNSGWKQDFILPEIRRALVPGGLLFLWNEKTFTPDEDPTISLTPFYRDDRESAGTAVWWAQVVCGHGFELREYRRSSYTFKQME